MREALEQGARAHRREGAGPVPLGVQRSQVRGGDTNNE